MADYTVANFSTLSVTELYDNEELLRWMMNVSIGVTDRDSRDRIVADGYTSLRAIVNQHTNDVESFVSYLKGLNRTFAAAGNAALRVYYSPVVISRFAGVIHYYNQSVNSLHCIPDASYVDNDYVTTLNAEYKAFDSNSEKDKEETEIEIPTLTGATNWINFRDMFVLKLSLVIGCRGFPIDYVIDETERAVKRGNARLIEVDELNLADEEVYKTKAVHFGKAFKKDNLQVWNMLKKLLLGTPVYNHIHSHNDSKDGRKAWITLKTFYEGEDFQARLKEKAFNKLLNTFYRGDNQRFSFEKYINAHKESHKLLQDSGYNNGLGLDEATKCHHFISGIKEQAGLEYALSTARSNPQYRVFSNLTSFLTAEVDHRNMRKKQLKSNDRNVSTTKSTRRGGNEQDKKKVKYRWVDGKKVFNKVYPKDEFRKLTQAQRDAVIGMYKGKNGGKNKTHNSSKLSKEDVASISEAIVAGVSKAQVADLSDTEETKSTSTISTKGSKRKAPSGGVGNFLSSRKKTNSEDSE